MSKPNPGTGTASRRYRELVAGLLAEKGATQKTVAKKLGTSQSYIAKLLDEDPSKTVGLGLVELAIKNQGLSPQFFFDERPTAPSFRDYVGPRSVPRVNYSALDRFLATAEGDDKPTPEELVHLERIDWDGEPTPKTYMLYLDALRTVKRRTVTVVKARPKPKSAS